MVHDPLCDPQLMIVGPLTIRPLLAVNAPSALFNLIRHLSSSKTPLPRPTLVRILPSLLKALRNLLVTTADLVWGHMWGVGAEKKVVGTGLVGVESGVETIGGKGKGVVGKVQNWREDAIRALGLSFEVSTHDIDDVCVCVCAEAAASQLELFDESHTVQPRDFNHTTDLPTSLPSHRSAFTSRSPSQMEPTLDTLSLAHLFYLFSP